MRILLFGLITVFAIFGSFRKPKIGLFYFLFLLFWRDGYLLEYLPQIYQEWHIPLIMGWVVLLSWLAYIVPSGGKVCVPREIVILAVLALVIFFSRYMIPGLQNAIYVFDEYIRMLILVFLIVNIIKTEADIKQISFLVMILTLLLVLYAYYRYKTEWLEIAVPSVYYVDRNFFAESIVAVIPIAFAFYETVVEKFKKYAFLLMTVALAGGVILTYSRGGLLALIIVLFFIFLSSKKKMHIIAIGLVSLALLLPHIGQKYIDRVDTVKEFEQDNSAMQRITTWTASIEMIKKNPVFGVGAGNFNDTFINYVPEEYLKYAGERRSIHNMFLQIFCETGFVGGGLFILVIISSFISLYLINRKNKRLSPERRLDLTIPNSFGISLIGFCGAGFFLPGAYYSYIYIIFALIMAAKNIYSKAISEAELANG
ncbi:MAG: O-antigen ligase family protein [Candidatus Omnitrophota bacterium]